ncbi:hypothetical protein DL95DRAFT_386388 [Leptodontidium sp. 2 PMI_412]|nr:hypothetical protein DL95DRAFT_386388 [Leptodontidium sp. 2 PMI_412]
MASGMATMMTFPTAIMSTAMMLMVVLPQAAHRLQSLAPRLRPPHASCSMQDSQRPRPDKSFFSPSQPLSHHSFLALRPTLMSLVFKLAVACSVGDLPMAMAPLPQLLPQADT